MKLKFEITQLIILGIFLISLASAMYAGECMSIDLSNLTSLDNVVYDVVGNSSSLEGLTIDLNGTLANICTVPNYKPDAFTIIFIDDSTKEIIKEVPVYRSGGGGGGTRKVCGDNETIVEVDKYIDREIYDTEIQRFEDDLKNAQDKLNEKNIRHTFFFYGFLVLLCFSIYILIKRERENGNNKM